MKLQCSIWRVSLFNSANFQGVLQLPFNSWLFLSLFIALSFINLFELFASTKDTSVKFVIFANHLQSLIVSPSSLYFASCCELRDTNNRDWLRTCGRTVWFFNSTFCELNIILFGNNIKIDL